MIDFGFNARFEDKFQCIKNKTGACSGSFDTTRLQSEINSKCVGNKSCVVGNLKTYVTQKKDVCTHDEASFFIQFFC